MASAGRPLAHRTQPIWDLGKRSTASPPEHVKPAPYNVRYLMNYAE